MQVSVESIGKLERRMQVQVPAVRVSSEIAARLKTPNLPVEVRDRVGEALKEIKKQAEPLDRKRTVGSHVIAAGDEMEQGKTVEAAQEFEHLATAMQEQTLKVKQAERDAAEKEAQIKVQQQEATRKQVELEATIIRIAEAERLKAVIQAEAAKSVQILTAEGVAEAVLPGKKSSPHSHSLAPLSPQRRRKRERKREREIKRRERGRALRKESEDDEERTGEREREGDR